VGSKRKDVEQHFDESGGLSFGAQTIFVYKECHLIRVEITFKHANGFTKSDDIVDSISKLSIDFEAKD
jgi:hypothetical protein